MAIRYTKSYNQEIRNAVKHAKAVERTLSRRGVKLGVRIPKVSELKAKYQTRRELNKELRLLNKLSSSDDKVLKQIETSGGATAIRWEFDYLKQNKDQAIKFFEWEKQLELRKNPKYPHEFERLNEIEFNLQTLQSDIDYMNQDQFKSYEGAIKEFFHIQKQMSNGYRGFLWQLENAMRMSGYNEEEIKSLFNKFKGLNPSQFREYYKTSGVVNRIYELVNSPTNGNEMKLTTSDEDARLLLDTLREEVDADIARIKAE